MVKILIDGIDKTKEIEYWKAYDKGYSIKYKNSMKYYNYSENRVKIENDNWKNNV